MHQLNISHGRRSSSYEIVISSGQLGQIGEWSAKCVCPSAKKVAIISNPTVFSLYGNVAERNLKRAGFATSVWLMKDGERYKDVASLNGLLKHLSNERLSRDDCVIALGGGVVGDLAGFAAAVYLRG